MKLFILLIKLLHIYVKFVVQYIFSINCGVKGTILSNLFFDLFCLIEVP